MKKRSSDIFTVIDVLTITCLHSVDCSCFPACENSRILSLRSGVVPQYSLILASTVYNILEQTPGNELMKKAQEKDVGILVRVPEASGILTGKVNAETKIDEKDHRSVRKGEWIKASLEKVEKLKPIAERNDLTITELSMKFIMSKKGFASVFPTVVSEEEIVNYVEMTKGGYISASDMKEIEELYNTWPYYELKATPQTS